MRVCVDTNVLISFLLNPNPSRQPFRIIQGAIDRRFELLISESTIQELLIKIDRKPYLSTHIVAPAAVQFIALLRKNATILPELTGIIPSIVRDAKDDYLVAHSLIEKVDFLVSGDKDLLSLGGVDHVRIVSPTDFVLLLDTLHRE